MATLSITPCASPLSNRFLFSSSRSGGAHLNLQRHTGGKQNSQQLAWQAAHRLSPLQGQRNPSQPSQVAAAASPGVPCLDPLASKVQVVGAGLNRQRQALSLGSSQLRQQVSICIPILKWSRVSSLDSGSSSR